MTVMEVEKVEKPNGIKGLTGAEIFELVGKARTKGVYGLKLLEFAQSDEAAINPADVWPLEFGSKEATTLYQGFNLAIKRAKMEDDIHILQSDGNVYILHKERVEIVKAQLAEAAAESDEDSEDDEA